MFEIRRSGPSIGSVIADIRDVRDRVLPYAAAIALTKAAKRGQKSVIAQMSSVFDRPTAYTLNATRIEVATKDSLSARIAIKDQRTGRAVRPESFLLPEVEGGGRSEKGFERALRFAGVLHTGERAIPGRGVQLDGNGNVSSAQVRSILRIVSKPGAAQKRRGRGRGAADRQIFAGALGKKQTRGIWQRDGMKTKALFIFTRKPPQYRKRLDFVGAAQTGVTDGFAADFYAAAATLRKRFAG